MSPSYEILHACPACGGRALHRVADRTNVQHQVEALWAFHTRRVEGGTPPRRLTDRSAFSQRPPLAIVACAGCGTLLRNPREDAETLRDVYADDDPDAATLAALLAVQRPTYVAQAKRLTRVLGRTGTVLEVGCYVGGFLDAAQAHGWEAHGIDVNGAAVTLAQERGLAASVGDIRDIDDARRYDAVVFWNVFEQLDDPT
ncbi:MAG: class I SAM-dependent methyltransferase, partial [Longimicrobiales bacterium]